MSFSATDAAFEGFRLTRRKPMTVIWWSLAYIVFFAAIFGLASGPFIQVISEMDRLEGLANPQMSDFREIGMIYMTLMSWILPMGLLFGAMLNAAVARAVVRPGQSAFGYLRLGMDEVRVLVVSLVLSLAFGALMALGGALVGFLAGFAGASGISGLWLGVVVAVIVLIALAVWLMVRFSLAVPIVVAERRFAFMDSFSRTKGRFWPLLGMAILAGVMSVLVSLLGSIIAQAVMLMTGSLDVLANMEDASLQEVLSTTWPTLVGWSLVNAVISALQLAIIAAPFSRAYLDLGGRGEGVEG